MAKDHPDSRPHLRVEGTGAEYLPAADSAPVEVGGPSLTLHSPGTLVVHEHPRPTLDTRIGLSAAGSFWLRVTSVEIVSDSQDEVSTEDLRNVRVIELIREHMPAHVGGSSFTPTFRASDVFGSAIRDQWPSQGAMKEVAFTYNVARALRLHPIKAVTDAFEISRSTAHRWVNQCREAGMISGG